MKTIGILAVQGAFAEHEKILHSLGAKCVELRKAEDLEREFDGIVLPGGESTVQGKLLKELDMFDELKCRINNGIPVLATCAGLILLAEHIVNDNRTYFATMPVTVRRNAYGRQLGSFSTTGKIRGLGAFPMRFIRAPYIETADDSVEVLSTYNDKITAVKYRSQIGLAFHPELTSDIRIHQIFLSMTK